MNARAVVLPALVLGAAAGIGLLYGRGEPPAAPAGGTAPGGGPAPPAPAAERKWHPEPVRVMTVPNTEKVPAVVRAPRPVVVVPPVRATPVARVLVREGDAVKKGDLLVTFQPAGWERALAAAEKAGDANGVEKAKAALASLEVRAPEDGLVYRVEARLGEMPIFRKDGPLPLVVLFDWSRLSYEGAAPAALASLLGEGAGVLVRSGRDFLVPAKVVRRDPPGPDGSFLLEVRPTEPPGVAPEPDGEAEIHVVTGRREVLVVPRIAVTREGGRPVVHVVPVAGELRPRPVVLGLSIKGDLVEASGVERNESVAVWE